MSSSSSDSSTPCSSSLSLISIYLFVGDSSFCLSADHLVDLTSRPFAVGWATSYCCRLSVSIPFWFAISILSSCISFLRWAWLVWDLSSDAISGDILASESGKQLTLAESGTKTGGSRCSCFICFDKCLFTGEDWSSAASWSIYLEGEVKALFSNFTDWVKAFALSEVWSSFFSTIYSCWFSSWADGFNSSRFCFSSFCYCLRMSRWRSSFLTSSTIS